MITYKQITTQDPLYPGECRLRERVLLENVGLNMDSFKSAYPGYEEKFLHFVGTTQTPAGNAWWGVRCCSRRPIDPDSGS